jgi:hypothetical protein
MMKTYPPQDGSPPVYPPQDMPAHTAGITDSGHATDPSAFAARLSVLEAAHASLVASVLPRLARLETVVQALQPTGLEDALKESPAEFVSKFTETKTEHHES